MLQFKTSFISMSGFALITTAFFSPGLHLGSEENMFQPFEVLGHSSSLLFNAHDCSFDGNAPLSLLSNDTLFEYEIFTDLNEQFLSVSLASEKKIVYDLIRQVPSGSCHVHDLCFSLARSCVALDVCRSHTSRAAIDDAEASDRN